MKTLLTFLASVFFTLLAGSALADDSVSLAKTGGEGIFVEKCGMCHQAGGMGTGILGRRLEGDLALLENRKDLQGEFITVVVRSGFNTMFPLSRIEVSDEQLDEIIDYLEE